MVNEFLIETLAEYHKLYAELEAMGAPEEALKIVRKSIEDTKLLIKQREVRKLETRELPAPVAESPEPESEECRSLTTAELVETFGTEKIKSSYAKTKKLAKNPRDAILKEASRFMKLEPYKRGRQVMYKVLKEYDEPKPIETNGYVEKSDVLPLIQLLVLHTLASRDGTAIMTKKSIAMDICMVNDSYNYIWDEKDRYGTDYEERFIKSEIVREVDRSIERALSSMKKRHMLYYNTDLFVKVTEVSEVVTDDEGNIVHVFDEPQVYNYIRETTDLEKKLITRARREACKCLKCINYNNVRFKGKVKLFHSIVNRKLNDWGLGYINRYFEGYKINADLVEVKHDLEQAIRKNKELELNGVVYNKLLERLIDKYNNDGVGFGDDVKLRFLPPPITSKKYLDKYVNK